MTMYALVPVRVKIKVNSAAEIQRAHELVQDIVKFWQDICQKDWEDNGPELDSDATSPETQPSWLEPREPEDTIFITIK